MVPMAIAERVEVVAHRGASAHAPEHTTAAYDLALAQGADVLELDLRLTGAGELAVVHDPTLLRTAGDPRRVDAVRLDELDPARRPLTLDEVLERYGTHTRYLLELKDPRAHWEHLVPEAVDRHGLRAHVTLQSFDSRSLRRLRLRAPWLPCAPLYRGRPVRLDAVAAWASGIGVWHGCLDAALVTAAHDRGLAVRAWTVNGHRCVSRALALGVDGLISDDPALTAALARRAPAPARARHPVPLAA